MEAENNAVPEGAGGARELNVLRRAMGAFDTCLVVWRGEAELTVHGCKKILLYSTEAIRLRVGRRTLCVRGKGLSCTSFSGGIMMLEGRIDAVYYETEERERTE